jgi:hypothetical protein
LFDIRFSQRKTSPQGIRIDLGHSGLRLAASLTIWSRGSDRFTTWLGHARIFDDHTEEAMVTTPAGRALRCGTGPRSKATNLEELPMQLLLIICRESLEHKVVELLEDSDVKGYTIIEKLRGAGKTGVVPSDWAGLNSLVMVTAPTPQAESIINMLKEFSRREAGHDIPLKLVAWACDVVI